MQAVADGVPLPLGGPKQRALLAELLLRGGAVVPRDHLVDAIWGDEPPASARSSLQVYVHGLRRVVGADRIETHGDGYRVRYEPEELDLARFERLLSRAEQALGEQRAADAAEDLDAAVALWAGPPLADLADQPVADLRRPRLEELQLRALELRNEARLELGEHDTLLPELEALVAAQPFRERPRRQQMLALYRAGRQKEALEAYRAAREAFIEELGVEPGPELRQLERAILQRDETLNAVAKPAVRRTRLPAAANALIGRRLEIAAVEALLRREDVRLVTLTGPGGTGKTRLALAVAEALAPELRDGARFVDLSSATEADVVLPAVGHALDIPESEDVLASVRDVSALVVLDNLEQLAAVAEPIADLLAAAPRLRILATSRTLLRCSGEHEYPVPPLPVPGAEHDFEKLVANDAVRLFAARAQAVDAEFALTDANIESVASVCRRLDGLPLAIELAAARTKVLPPAAIEERLGSALDLLVAGARDLPERQQTLRATLDWSHELLAAPERELLASVSVFAGGWTLADADAVLGRDTSLGLEALLDSSLVRRRGTADAPRFVLLETIREYAGERLRELGLEAELHERHARHFAEVADRAWSDIFAGGDAEAAAYPFLDIEHDNIRAALAWAHDAGDVELESRIAIALRWYWLVRGHLDEGRRVFGALIEKTVAEPELQAHLLVIGASFPWRLGELDEARAQWEQSLALYRELGDDEGIARSIAELGAVALSEDDLDRAREIYEESVTLFERLGNRPRLAIVLSNLAAIAAQSDDPLASVAHSERAIAIQREAEDVNGLGVSLANITRVRLALDDVAGARRDLRESMGIAIRIGYQMLLAYTIGAAAEIALREGDNARAARLVGAAAGAFEAIGMPIPGEEVEEHEKLLTALRAQLEATVVDALVAEGRAAPLDDMVAEALDLTE